MSLKNRFLLALMRVPGLKRCLSTPRTVRMMVRFDRWSGPARPGSRMMARCRVAVTTHRGRPVYAVTPKSSPPRVHVLYLHGGAYVVDILAPHWHLIERLALDGRAALSVPLYPLGPESACTEAVDFVVDGYRTLSRHVPAEDIVVMGDSAGGGLALILAQRLAEAGMPQPRKLVLLSPWLDLSMSNPAIAAIEDTDPYLSTPAALEAARLYAGDVALDHPLVSPIHGPMGGLPEIAVFTGTRDILNPDARLLVERVNRAGGRATLHEMEEMIHAWMLFPLPEADEALRRILAEMAPAPVVEPAV